MKVFELESDSERGALFSWLIENSNGTSTLEDCNLTNSVPVGAIIVIKSAYDLPVVYIPLTDSQPADGAEALWSDGFDLVRQILDAEIGRLKDEIAENEKPVSETAPASQEAEEFYKRDLRRHLATTLVEGLSISELEETFQWVWNGTVA